MMGTVEATRHVDLARKLEWKPFLALSRHIANLNKKVKQLKAELDEDDDDDACLKSFDNVIDGDCAEDGTSLDGSYDNDDDYDEDDAPFITFGGCLQCATTTRCTLVEVMVERGRAGACGTRSSVGLHDQAVVAWSSVWAPPRSMPVERMHWKRLWSCGAVIAHVL